MTYLIPFAAVGSEGCARAWAALKLPHWDRLMQRMRLDSAKDTLHQPHTDMSDVAMGLWAADGKTPWLGEYSLSPPHERELAGALGIWTRDGEIPWAALELQKSQAFNYQPGQAWAQITPCFWHVGVDQIQMLHPDALHLSEEDSRTVLGAVQPYFAEDGITLHYDTPTRWYAQSKLFDGLATASLDRVVGRNVNAWMPEGPQAAPLRRLQNEMQMLLYTHAVNDRRHAAGLLAVNSFWVSGAGALQATALMPDEVQVIDNLRTPALYEDWAAWSAAWQQLDSTVIKDLADRAWRGESIKLTLCGERAAQHWQSFQPSLKQRFTSLFGLKPNKIMHNQL
jgi:hypothetical protein